MQNKILNTIFKLFFLLAIFFVLPNFSHAAISFDQNGKWETTANCTAATYPASVNCDGIVTYGSGTSENNFMSNYPTGIYADANNQLGAGGRGFRFWDGDYAYPDGTGYHINICSAPLNVDFPALQSELWVRWYQRWQEGYKWTYDYAGTHYSPGFTKLLYFSDGEIVSMLSGNEFYIYGGGQKNYANQSGWKDLFPLNHGLSDGRWIEFEVHMKYNSAEQNNGVGQIWVDGQLKASRSDVDYGTAGGWTDFHFDSNQNEPDNANGPIGDWKAYVDYDDMTVYSATPPKVDASGNPFIGPIVSNDAIAPSALTGLGVM